MGTGTAGFIQVEQAILRGCGARWRFPEYFSGDASNNNMASSIVAGSPFVVAVEGNQLEWGEFERAVARKVLELSVESGRLSEADVAAVDVKVTPPAVALEKREEEERIRQMRHQAGVLSITTWQQQVGLDPAHEAANFETEARRTGEGRAEAGGAKRPGEAREVCAGEDKVREAKGKKGLIPAQRKTDHGLEKHLVRPDTVGKDGWQPVAAKTAGSKTEPARPAERTGSSKGKTGKRQAERARVDALFKGAPAPTTPQKVVTYLGRVSDALWSQVKTGGPAAERLAEHVAAAVCGQRPAAKSKGLSDLAPFRAKLKGGKPARIAVNGKLMTLRSDGDIRVGKGEKYWYEQRKRATQAGVLLAALGVQPGYAGRPGGLYLRVPAGDMYLRRDGTHDAGTLTQLVGFERLEQFVRNPAKIREAMGKVRGTFGGFDMGTWRKKTKQEQEEYQRRTGAESTVPEAAAFARGAATDPKKGTVVANAAAHALPPAHQAAHAGEVVKNLPKEHHKDVAKQLDPDALLAAAAEALGVSVEELKMKRADK